MGTHLLTPCPQCGSTDCRESRWRSHEEKTQNPDRHPYRCLSCAHRFIAPVDAARRSSKRRHTALLVVAAGIVVGTVVGALSLLWPDDLATQQAASSADAEPRITHPTLEAAHAGDAEAQFRVGRATLQDTSRGKEGTAEALSWLQQAASKGHTRAMLQLGALYRSGVGVPQNYEYAEKWVRTAANAGNSEAMVELGRLYRSGLGVKHDPIKAYVWFNRAAAAMNMDGARERDLIALKLSAQELKTAQAESLAAEEDSTSPAVPAQD